MIQNFSANQYRGKRIRFSALAKTDDVEGWGGLWMRVDDISKPTSSFDDMSDRPIKGTTVWTPYSVVLDTSENASGVLFLLMLTGKGQLWVSNLQFGFDST